MTGHEEGPDEEGVYLFFSDTRIFKFEPTRRYIGVLYESSDKKKLSSVRPIVGKYAIYFVETDLELQMDRIMRVTLPSHNGNCTGIKRYDPIHTMLGSDIVAM